MKDYRKSFRRAASVLVLTVTLACSFAAAQSTAPSGSYGFVVNAFQIDSNGANGGALVGIINFDGAGNVTGYRHRQTSRHERAKRASRSHDLHRNVFQ
jgi:hypothetical protein